MTQRPFGIARRQCNWDCQLSLQSAQFLLALGQKSNYKTMGYCYRRRYCFSLLGQENSRYGRGRLIQREEAPSVMAPEPEMPAKPLREGLQQCRPFC